ncbi:MAG: motility protein A [Elusimicrobiota bacterium]
MDYMSIAGMLLGLGAVYYTAVTGNILSIIFNKVAFILVFGGTVGATLLTYPWKIIKNLPGSLMMMIKPPEFDEYSEMIEKITDLANIAISSGVDELNTQLDSIDDPFLKSAVIMLLEGMDEEDIEDNLDTEIAATYQRHQQTIVAWKSMGSYAPVFGLLGTLIGIVQILRDISDPSTMGANMAVAITTTFYGIFAANFIFLPAAGKLEIYSQEELTLRELQKIGVISISKGMLPVVIRKKLERFLAKSRREEK